MAVVKKKELVNLVQQKVGGTKAQAKQYIDALSDVLVECVASGNEVAITGIFKMGIFDYKVNRNGKNHSGKYVKIKAGQRLKDSIKNDS